MFKEIDKMKKIYSTPVIEAIDFDNQDMLMTSGGASSETGGGTDGKEELVGGTIEGTIGKDPNGFDQGSKGGIWNGWDD